MALSAWTSLKTTERRHRETTNHIQRQRGAIKILRSRGQKGVECMLLAISLVLIIVAISWMNIRHLSAKGKRIELELYLGWKGIHLKVTVR